VSVLGGEGTTGGEGEREGEAEGNGNGDGEGNGKEKVKGKGVRVRVRVRVRVTVTVRIKMWMKVRVKVSVGVKDVGGEVSIPEQMLWLVTRTKGIRGRFAFKIDIVSAMALNSPYPRVDIDT